MFYLNFLDALLVNRLTVFKKNVKMKSEEVTKINFYLSLKGATFYQIQVSNQARLELFFSLWALMLLSTILRMMLRFLWIFSSSNLRKAS